MDSPKFDATANYGEGERNEATYKYACSLRAQGIPESQATDEVQAWSAQHAGGLPTSEVAKAVRSAYSHPEGHSAQFDATHPQHGGRKWTPIISAASQPAISALATLKESFTPRSSLKIRPEVMAQGADLLAKQEAQRAIYEQMDPNTQAISQLTYLFEPGEYVAIADPSPDKVPLNPRAYERDELIKRLESSGDRGSLIGAYIIPNPVKEPGHKGGISNKSVVEGQYRYLLLEHDPNTEHWESLTAAEQESYKRDLIAKLLALQLPIATITDSGHKSIHALVEVDAKDMDQFKERAEYVFDVAEANGFTPDRQNSNPARWSRRAGAKRGEANQSLLFAALGQANYEEWSQWAKDNLAPVGEVGQWEALRDHLMDWEALSNDYLNPPQPVPTAIEALDEILGGGLRPGPTILAGAPGTGKSALAIAIAANVARIGGNVVILSAEMTTQQVIARIGSYLAQGRAEGLEGCTYRYADWERMGFKDDPRGLRVIEAIARLKGLAITDDNDLITNEAGVCALIETSAAAGADLIILDYLQIVDPSNPTGSTTEDVRTVIRSITAAAKRAKLPVLVLSSTSRKHMEKGTSEEASITAAMGSSQIEYDAVASVFLNRGKETNNLEACITKNRFGPIRDEQGQQLKVHLACDYSHNYFWEIERDRYQTDEPHKQAEIKESQDENSEPALTA